jgi:hypothetical protein
MRVALLNTFAASKKEPLAAMMDRIHQAFLDAGPGEPVIRFNFGGAPIATGVSSVDRVLKRYPELERFVTSASPMPGIQGARRISNGPLVAVRLPSGSVIPSVNPEAVRAVQGIVTDYRARMKEVLERAALPHNLPPAGEAYRDTPLGVGSGPRKPSLERSFKPMGYSCRGESGTFSLRRRTAANLTLELHLDVGTWGHKVVGAFRVWGLGFKAALIIPVSANGVIGAQYPIGDADRWQKIVENLAALVPELERSFVPEIEVAAGPSPEWYEPQS